MTPENTPINPEQVEKTTYEQTVDKLVADLAAVPEDDHAESRRKIGVEDFLYDILDRADTGEITGSTGTVYTRDVMVDQFASYLEEIAHNRAKPLTRIPSFDGLRKGFDALSGNPNTNYLLIGALTSVARAELPADEQLPPATLAILRKMAAAPPSAATLMAEAAPLPVTEAQPARTIGVEAGAAANLIGVPAVEVEQPATEAAGEDDPLVQEFHEALEARQELVQQAAEDIGEEATDDVVEAPADDLEVASADAEAEAEDDPEIVAEQNEADKSLNTVEAAIHEFERREYFSAEELQSSLSRTLATLAENDTVTPVVVQQLEHLRDIQGAIDRAVEEYQDSMRQMGGRPNPDYDPRMVLYRQLDAHIADVHQISRTVKRANEMNIGDIFRASESLGKTLREVDHEISNDEANIAAHFTQISSEQHFATPVPPTSTELSAFVKEVDAPISEVKRSATGLEAVYNDTDGTLNQLLHTLSDLSNGIMHRGTPDEGLLERVRSRINLLTDQELSSELMRRSGELTAAIDAVPKQVPELHSRIR